MDSAHHLIQNGYACGHADYIANELLDDTRMLLNSPNDSETVARLVPPMKFRPRSLPGRDLYRLFLKQSVQAKSWVAKSSISKLLIAKTSDARSFVAKPSFTKPITARSSEANSLIPAISSADFSIASSPITRSVTDTDPQSVNNADCDCQELGHNRIPPWSSQEERETAPLNYCQDEICFENGEHDYWHRVCTDCTRAAKGARWEYTALQDPQRTLWLSPLCDKCEDDIRRSPQESSCECVEEIDGRHLCPGAVDRTLQKMNSRAKARLDWMMMRLARTDTREGKSTRWSWQGKVLCRCRKPVHDEKKRAMWCMVCSHTVLIEPTANFDSKWSVDAAEEQMMADEVVVEYEMI